MDRPLPNSYWVVPGSLLAGEHPYDGDDAGTAERLQRLLDAGIDSFLDLTQTGERPDYDRLLPSDVQVVRRAIRDTSVPSDIAEMRSIQAHLHSELAQGRRVYVHCRAGIGRTGTVIGCYLAEQGQEGSQALAALNRLWRQSARSAGWPEVPQTQEQAHFIRQWPQYRRAQAESPELSSRRDLRERFLGCLLGLAAVDALSVTTQSRSAGTFKPMTDIVGGGVFEMPAGHWSDDTALSLCAAESLLKSKGFEPPDQLQHAGRWQQGGYLPGGRDRLGITLGTARALYRVVPGAPKPALTEPFCNEEPAPLSRIAPLVMFYYSREGQAVACAQGLATLFDASALVQDSCRVLAGMLHGALRGEPLPRVLQPRDSLLGPQPLCAPLLGLLQADPTLEPSAQLPPSLFVLAAARWALSSAGSFRAGALRVANLGGGSDVIGAVYGQLAGAFYGYASIPSDWLRSLARREPIEKLAQQLFAADSGAPIG